MGLSLPPPLSTLLVYTQVLPRGRAIVFTVFLFLRCGVWFLLRVRRQGGGWDCWGHHSCFLVFWNSPPCCASWWLLLRDLWSTVWSFRWCWGSSSWIRRTRCFSGLTLRNDFWARISSRRFCASQPQKYSSAKPCSLLIHKSLLLAHLLHPGRSRLVLQLDVFLGLLQGLLDFVHSAQPQHVVRLQSHFQLALHFGLRTL